MDFWAMGTQARSFYPELSLEKTSVLPLTLRPKESWDLLP